jgi:hypothetical protein
LRRSLKASAIIFIGDDDRIWYCAAVTLNSCYLIRVQNIGFFARAKTLFFGNRAMAAERRQVGDRVAFDRG